MSFAYAEPASVEETFALLGRYGDDAMLVAGGTAFVLLLKQGLVRPACVIALRRLAALRGISRTPDGGLRIGALTTHREAELSADVRAYCPALAETFGHVATVRIRNQATVGGNLAHADPAQDPPVMLLALGAAAVVASARGERRVPLSELFVDLLETTLAADEILTGVECPPLPAATRAVYRKFLPRTRDDYATVSVGAVRAGGTTVIALGGVAPTPVRVSSAGDVQGAIDPIDDDRGSAAYKRRMADVWTERALAALK